MLTDCKAATLLRCGHDGVAAGTDTAQASRGDLSVAARGLYGFYRAYNQFWAPKYHLKSYIIRPISVLYLCGTNVQMYPYGNHAMG